MSNIKISELPEIEVLQDGCCMPVVSNGETTKMYYSKLKEKLQDDLQLSIPIATADTLGAVKIGDNLNVETDGTINANKQTDNNYTTAEKNKLADLSNYDLPIASESVLGGIKVGANLTIDEDGKLNASGGSSTGEKTPVGAVMQYAGSTAPTNWLICDGSAVSRTTYAELFNVIGTTYGTGDGSTTFNLPNSKGRVPVGVNSSDTDFNSLGKTGGEKTHKLTIEEMPRHNHTSSIINGNEIRWGGTGNMLNLESSNLQWTAGPDGSSIITGTSGAGQAHNNLQPYLVMNYIIKAL